MLLKLSRSCSREEVGGIVLAVLIALGGTSCGQYLNAAHSARSGAMGGCFVADDTVRHVAVDYRRGYMLAEMADKRCSVVWPTRRIGTIYADYLHHGDAAYHEQQLMAGYGLRVLPWFRVGVGASYLHVGTDDAWYEPRRWLGASVTAAADVGRSVRIAVLAGSRPWDELRPWRAHVQMAYRPIVPLLTVVELESEERVRVRAGVEYCYRDLLFVRAGMVTRPVVATFGVGVRYRWLSIDLSAETHRVLGLTPQTTVTLWF